ncbi:MAG: hypothetical protein Q4F34_07445 [Prevotellaceae bacterium]|nr:hypothetical protein [Prevotellaceae bacterium]
MKKILSIVAALFICTAMQAQVNEVYAEYTPYKLHLNGGGSTVSSDNVTSFALGYNRFFDIACEGKLKAVAGGKLTYGSKNDYKQFNVRIPVSIMYSAAVNEDFAIEPYAGLNATVGIVADDGDSWYDEDYLDASRVNAGWHVGVDFAYKQYVLGFAYQSDFTKIFDRGGVDGKWSDFEIKVGYRF